MGKRTNLKVFRVRNNLTQAQITDALAATGLTVAAAAEALGVPYRTLQNWKLGVNTPSAFVQDAVLKKLNELKEKE